jgi:hypothetical protein
MASGAAEIYELPSPKKRASSLEGELGVTLDLPFGTWNEEIFNPNEINVPDLLVRLDQMQRNDGHIRALYRLLSLPFRRATFRLDEADGGGEEEADFVTQVFTRPPYEGDGQRLPGVGEVLGRARGSGARDAQRAAQARPTVSEDDPLSR